MTSLTRYSADRRGPAQPKAVPTRPSFRSDDSAARVDLALLFCALFLQRFSLPFGSTFLMLDFVPVTLIVVYQFLAGKLVIHYDRLLWFLATALTVTCSLLLNFNSMMLNSYFLFMASYPLLTLSRSSTGDRYKGTLQAFQFLVLLLSSIGVAQFFAQFVVDGRKLVMFYGIVPDFLFGFFYAGGENTIHTLYEGSAILKSNGLFLGEPSNFSQITALGILIEVLEFRRPKYLLIMALGFLVAYSGTGLMILLLFLPLAGLRHRRAGLSALVVVMFALGLFAMGVIELSVFSSRVGEFQDPHSSAFGRFVAPLKLTAQQFDTASLFSLLVGNGPGTTKILSVTTWYIGAPVTWYKLFVEYGIIGSFVFVCFLASCLRNSRCPGVVLWALLFIFIFFWGLVGGEGVAIIMVLCTLNGPEARQSRTHKAGGANRASIASPFVSGS